MTAEVYLDTRLIAERWVIGDRSEMMRIPDELLTCVAFIAGRDVDDSMHYGGTAFSVGFPYADGSGRHHLYLVTAAHNVRKCLNTYGNIFIRFNVRGAGAVPSQILMTWLFPDNESVEADDVAVLPVGSLPGVFEFTGLPMEMCATESLIAAESIGIGDELLVVGLFTVHHGKRRNLPIVRGGMIASMPHEPLADRNSGLPYDGYLAEVRSIGGLSGSPVFAVLGPARAIPGKGYSITGQTSYVLLGLIRGHWDKTQSMEFADYAEDGEKDELNTGIAIVTPITKAIKIMESEAEVERRKKVETEQNAKEPATEDSAFGEPSEFERFEDLTEKLVKTPKPEKG